MDNDIEQINKNLDAISEGLGEAIKARDFESSENTELQAKIAALEEANTLMKRELLQPKIQYLKDAYSSVVTEESVKALEEGWQKKGIAEIDDEITRLKPFVDALNARSKVSVMSSAKDPISPVTLTPLTRESSLDTVYGKADALELWNAGGTPENA